MNRRNFLAGLLACPLCASSAATPEWNYRDAGPQKWPALDPSFASCGSGDQQSPIDLRDGVKAELPKIRLNWKKEKFSVWNNGHTIQVSGSAGSGVQLGPEHLALMQFHFHAPSEHAIGGKAAAMEVHFVHKHQDERLVVIAALMTPGAPNDAFSAVIEVAPKRSGEKEPSREDIDPRELLPVSLDSTWRYAGSLTTPPCSQTVDWIIFDQPVSVAAKDVESFKRIFPMNARPRQPLNRRYLLRG